MAVDASIWIYQFLKAVRDKEGNSLSQSHIVGFFRRICKLLYFGIQPLFVFDGGAPPLKRQVIQQRRERRLGNQANAQMTAQKLLAIQVQRGSFRVPEPETRKRKSRTPEIGGDGTVYLEDLPMQHPSHPQNAETPETSPKRFIKLDEFHLPDLKQFSVSRKDTRIMPESEFQEYADNETFDIVDGIDIETVDPRSTEFAELPMATQYMILSHLRLKSRLRMGYTKDQLEGIFPDSKDFSRFQIEQVQKRNFYTQRLMNVSGMSEDSGNITRRIASDKDRNYSLVKNEGGWTLSLGGDLSSQPIELDENGDMIEPSLPVRETISVKEEDSDDSLEDVPLENQEDDADDQDTHRAVIESIYDMYKGDYEGAQLHEETLLEVSEVANPEKTQYLEANALQDFDDIELQKAVEESKKEYLVQRENEAALQEKLDEVVVDAGKSDFDFGLSILFGDTSPVKLLPQPPKEAPQSTKKTSQSTKKVSFEPQVRQTERQVNVHIEQKPKVSSPAERAGLVHQEEEIMEIEGLANDEPEDKGEPKSIPATQTLPTWFNLGLSHINSPYAATEFTEDKPRKRKLDEDEQAGIISWTEAQDMMEESESDAERPKNEDDSDVEIVESRNVLSVEAKQQPIEVDTASEPPIVEVVKESRAQKKAELLEYDFEEQEEEDLVRQLRDEEVQHAQFTTEIKASHQLPIGTSITSEHLLQEKMQKAKRDADEVSQTMINDVQELLRRFGIPYITAPMEAEAQCAELYTMGLVDGIVTDDSDCFLFGGSRIYKNMFNQKQYVECYLVEDLQNRIGLDQKKLIDLALLLGSDYTEGIKGIGPVLAMEILAEFGTLENFKKWFDKNTKLATADETHTALEKNLLTRVKNGKLFLPDNFPDPIVVNAYMHAEVDKDDSEFKWGVPSLDQIRTFLMYNVGWSQQKVDEVMIPLVRDMNRKKTEGTQATIGEFFPQETISYTKEIAMGKRMKVAAKKLNDRKI